MNQCQMIHETVLRDIVDVINDVKDFDQVEWIKNKNSVGSIAKRASNLVLVFPVLVSNSLSIQTATIISKAIERKCAALLQILFSAINLTKADNLQDYITQFHANLNRQLTLDDFMDTVDKLSEAGIIKITDEEIYRSVKEDMHNINYFLDTTYNPTAIIEFVSKTNKYGESYIFQEAKDGPSHADATADDILSLTRRDAEDILARANKSAWNYSNKKASDAGEFSGRISGAKAGRRSGEVAGARAGRQAGSQSGAYAGAKAGSLTARKISKNVATDIAGRTATNVANARIDDFVNMYNQVNEPDLKDTMDYFRYQLLPQDVQKANELMPTLMAVNFTTYDDKGFKHSQTGIIGIKAKLYPIDSMDIVTRLSSKYSDKNTLFKFIKASTREISFFRDFLFAIDNAKLDAINVAKESNNAKIFKLLERRANKYKFSALFKKNDASPITTLVMSQDEVEYLKRYNNIDMEKAGICKAIMEAYNLMCITIADESLEIAKFLYDDGDGVFEALSFDGLEKEAKDSSYKKVVNLMSKINR